MKEVKEGEETQDKYHKPLSVRNHFLRISHFTKISQCLEKTSNIWGFFAYVFVSSTLFCALDT